MASAYRPLAGRKLPLEFSDETELNVVLLFNNHLFNLLVMQLHADTIVYLN